MDRVRRRALRRGFTLIELLAVILIISILVTALTPMINDAIEASKVTACAANLRELHKGLVLYENKFHRIPDQSGVRFFAALIAKGAMDKTKPNCERLSCPAIDKSSLAIGTMDWEQWWSDLDRVDGTYSAYAGRDLKNHPLRKGITSSGREPLIADDNDPELNHRTTTNVLYADGSVQTFEFLELQEQGSVTPDETTLVVGPDSPVPDLAKLTLD